MVLFLFTLRAYPVQLKFVHLGYDIALKDLYMGREMETYAYCMIDIQCCRLEKKTSNK